MKATGIVRRIDDLGRIVIPKEIRRVLRIREGDPIEIYTDENGVTLKKYARISEIGDYAETYCQALCGALGFSAAVTDTETILFAAGPLKKRLLGLPLSKTYVERIRSQQMLSTGDGYNLSDGIEPVLKLCAAPILSMGDLIGSVLIATDDARLALGETETHIVKTAALYLGKQLE